MSLVGGVQVRAVESCDRDGEHELQEADEDLGPGDRLAAEAVVLLGNGVHAEAGCCVSFRTVLLLLASCVLARLLLAVGGCLSGAERFLLRWEIRVERVAFGGSLWRRW